MKMNFKEYAHKAMKTASFKTNDYPLLLIMEEVIEVYEKIEMRAVKVEDIYKELGDLSWGFAAFATVMRFDLNALSDEVLKTLPALPERPKTDLALLVECGNLVSLISKLSRKTGASADDVIDVVAYPTNDITRDLNRQIFDQLVNCLKQWIYLCRALDVYPADIMTMNIEKLKGRKERGTLEGSGDNR